MQAFFEMVVEQKCEGLMVKLLESGEGMTGDDAEDDDEGRGGGGGGGSGGKKKKGNGGKKKPLPATYEPDQRSEGWLKVKKGEYSYIYLSRGGSENLIRNRLSRRIG